MQSMKRQVLSSGSTMVVAATGLLLGVATFAYGADGTNANAVRHVRGRTVFSEESPKVELSIRKGIDSSALNKSTFMGLQRRSSMSLQGRAATKL